MAAARSLLLASFLLSCLIQACYASVLFSSLQSTYQVTTSTKQDQVLKAGEDTVKVTWGLNQTLPAGTDSDYKTVTIKLCYAPISQVDRAWRRTEDHISKDKTCQFKIIEGSHNKSLQTMDWTIERDVPTGTYFVRAYVYNVHGHEVAYGQSTDPAKKLNLFQVQSISGRHMSLDIASVCFSAFSIVSLLGFFFNEKRKGKNEAKK